jgi:hypothetical protein
VISRLVAARAITSGKERHGWRARNLRGRRQQHLWRAERNRWPAPQFTDAADIRRCMTCPERTGFDLFVVNDRRLFVTDRPKSGAGIVAGPCAQG